MIALLPDEPRWVEVRSMLMSGRAEVLELTSTHPPVAVVLDATSKQGAIVGSPPLAIIQRLDAQADELLVEPDRVDWVARALPNWRHEMATLYILGGNPRLPYGSGRAVTAGEIAAWPEIPGELREELLFEAGLGTTIYATFARDKPAAFCYPGSITETLWDVSIDTLEPYRRQGYAAQCVAYTAERMWLAGKQPVWGATASNRASAALARKLGFVPVDSIAVFTRP